jgi:signal transduction histidine kinase
VREQFARLRIVRELDEVAAHSTSTIVSQAEGARYAGEAEPAALARAVVAIGDTARKTLADLRRILTVVQEGESDAVPLPRLTSVSDLVEVMRDAGLVVEFEETGEPFDLPKGAELAVYRLVQEALSNSLKHGGEGTEATVSFTWRDESLQVVIDDNGARAGEGYTIDDDASALTAVVSGPGMSEMRERVELFGGVLTARPVPGVGFSVTAVFPALRYDNGIHGVNLGGRRGEE